MPARNLPAFQGLPNRASSNFGTNTIAQFKPVAVREWASSLSKSASHTGRWGISLASRPSQVDGHEDNGRRH